MSIILTSAINAQDLNLGLQGRYDLDGSVIDLSQNQIHGNNLNVEFAPGINQEVNSCGSFNGTNAYVDLGPSNRGIDREVCLSAWVKTDSDERQFVISKYKWQEDRGYFLAIDQGRPIIGGRLNCNEFYQCIGDVNLSDGNWHHVLGIINNNVFQIWAGCRLLSTLNVDCSNPNLSCSDPLTIGNWFQGGNGDYRFFEGLIDQVRIYNRALTEEEIILLCNESTLSDLNDPETVIERVRIFPNPFDKVLLVNFDNYLTGSHFRIYDFKGKIVKRGILKSHLNMSELTSGVYLFEIIDQNNLRIKVDRLIKH